MSFKAEKLFFFLQNYFDINETTGILFVKSVLDRETAEKIELKVLVKDLNGWQPSADQQTATGKKLL